MTHARGNVSLLLVGLCVFSAAYVRETNAQTVVADIERQSATSRSGIEEVVVTARKREETVIDVPISVTAFSTESLERLNIRSFTDYATKTPNLSFAYGTNELGFGSSRTVSIRGISGTGTVGVYIDDTPVPESIDPRVVDIARVEVLKGPQGTLFGQGSLGGNLRIITVQPSATDLNIHTEARLGGTSGGSGPDFGASFAGSQVLIKDTLVARVVGFIDHTAGYLTRTYPGASGKLVYVNNQGAVHSYGGSLALLFAATDRLSVTGRIMFQHTHDYGWPAPYAPLPAFRITSLTLNRTMNVQEGTIDHWYLPSVTLNYRGDGFTVVSSTSYLDRDVKDTEDGTEGTAWYNGLFLPGVSVNQAFPWDESIPQRITTNETRISFDPNHGFSGTAGIYISQEFSNEIDDGHNQPGLAAAGYTNFPGYCPGTPPCPSYNTDLIWYSAYPLKKLDQAIFGELYYDWHALQFTVGLRGYKERQTLSSVTMGAEQGGYVARDLGVAKQHGVTPKAAISYKVNPDTLVYASAAKGFRSGGNGQALPPTCGLLPELGITPGVPTKYDSDTVWNYEIGGKTRLADGRMVLTGALFQMNWNNIQQGLTLPLCFLGIRVNEGAARARGGEIELSGHPWERLEVRGGVGYDDAKITSQGVSVLPPVGSRVIQIPKLTANFSGTYSQPVTERMMGWFTADASYVGDSTSSTASLGYALTRASYTLVNSSIGISWGRSELSLYAANITNQHPNLGDLNPASYVRHDGTGPNAPTIPRVATLQPFNAGVQFRQRF